MASSKVGWKRVPTSVPVVEARRFGFSSFMGTVITMFSCYHDTTLPADYDRA